MTIVYLSVILVVSLLLVVNSWELRRLRRQIEEQRARLHEDLR